jgi:hypothetical protein
MIKIMYTGTGTGADIYIAAFDFDGCGDDLFHPINTSQGPAAAAEITKNEIQVNWQSPLVLDFLRKIIRERPKKVIICSFSNRFFANREWANTMKRGSFSSIIAFEVFTKSLQYFFMATESALKYRPEIFLDTYLLADTCATLDETLGMIYTDLPVYPLGTTWEAISRWMKSNKKLPKTAREWEELIIKQTPKDRSVLDRRSIADRSKILLFHLIIHRHCTAAAVDNMQNVKAVFYDDLPEVVNHIGRDDYADLLPRMLTDFEVWWFEARRAKEPGYKPQLIKQGSGAGDINYRWSHDHKAFISTQLDFLKIRQMNPMFDADIQAAHDELRAVMMRIHAAPEGDPKTGIINPQDLSYEAKYFANSPFEGLYGVNLEPGFEFLFAASATASSCYRQIILSENLPIIPILSKEQIIRSFKVVLNDEKMLPPQMETVQTLFIADIIAIAAQFNNKVGDFSFADAITYNIHSYGLFLNTVIERLHLPVPFNADMFFPILSSSQQNLFDYIIFRTAQHLSFQCNTEQEQRNKFDELVFEKFSNWIDNITAILKCIVSLNNSKKAKMDPLEISYADLTMYVNGLIRTLYIEAVKKIVVSSQLMAIQELPPSPEAAAASALVLSANLETILKRPDKPSSLMLASQYVDDREFFDNYFEKTGIKKTNQHLDC